MTHRLFGTDGVRGVANEELTPLLAFKLGRAGAHVLSEVHRKPTIIVGKDTRISGDMLEAALAAGICSVGANVIRAGVLPTPAIAYLVKHFNADAGVVISASHNPVEYNGIKFFDENGYKLKDEMEDEIEDLLDESRDTMEYPTGTDVGSIFEKSGLRAYVDFIKASAGTRFDGLKIAMDCANGAAYMAAPLALTELGAKVHVINNEPDGCNINFGAGSTHPEVISDLVKRVGADVGLAFDGDADRLIAADENGEIVDGDHIMAVCGIYLKKKGLLKKDTVVATVMSNMGLEAAFKAEGIQMVRSSVGDRYVLEAMLKNGYCLGGEQSGHVIFLDHNSTGDGLLTAVNLLKVMADEKKSLSTLRSKVADYPQVLVNLHAPDKSRYFNNKRIEEAILKAELYMADKGRILVRPSGTEPLIRVMVEGEVQEMVEKVAREVCEVVSEEL